MSGQPVAPRITKSLDHQHGPDLFERLSAMTADLQQTVSGMTSMAESDVQHLAVETVEGMADIAAGRLVDPDENISLPPSVLALATGLSIEDVVAERMRPVPLALPSEPPWNSTVLAGDIQARGERRYAEIWTNADARARQMLEDRQRDATDRIATIRRRLGLDTTAR